MSRPRPLTEKQWRRLLILGSGAIALAPGRADWKPFIRRGYVEPITEDDRSRYLPALQITADGLRALADGVERFGLPKLDEKPVQHNELPSITDLKAMVEKERQAKWEAQREATQIRNRLARAQRALEGQYT